MSSFNSQLRVYINYKLSRYYYFWLHTKLGLVVVTNNSMSEIDVTLCWRSRENFSSAVGVSSAIMYDFLDTHICCLKDPSSWAVLFTNSGCGLIWNYSDNIMLSLYTKQWLDVVANNSISETVKALCLILIIQLSSVFGVSLIDSISVIMNEFVGAHILGFKKPQT